YCHQFTHLRSLSHMGPIALYDGKNSAEDLLLAAQIVARFGGGQFADTVRIEINTHVDEARIVEVAPIKAENIAEHWYI
ncbi:MAG TPA: tRNA (5-methylaminomethyl-2-thiouridylate)-methyltransferase, partial [Gammaproteobacteria bacterium]|nr:tRNA (5-methylaminomethyl-2-thiouridylate)-methyltransferase [Gammaproteobacteria bacterium]